MLTLNKASCRQERDSTNKTYCYDYSAPVIDPKTAPEVCSSNWVKQVCEAIVIKSCGNPGSDACEKQLKKCIKSMSSNQSTDPNCQCKRPQQVTQWWWHIILGGIPKWRSYYNPNIRLLSLKWCSACGVFARYTYKVKMNKRTAVNTVRYLCLKKLASCARALKIRQRKKCCEGKVFRLFFSELQNSLSIIYVFLNRIIKISA